MYAIRTIKSFFGIVSIEILLIVQKKKTPSIFGWVGLELFEAVQQSQRFPFRVKTFYRAYTSDKVIEFENKHPSDCYSHIGSLTGLEPRTVHIWWYPDDKTIVSRQGIKGLKEPSKTSKYVFNKRHYGSWKTSAV